MQGINIQTHYIRAPDGTQICYFDSREDLPVIVLANGLGGPLCAWHPYFERWRGRFRVLSWDYRGLYGSPIKLGDADLSVASHADDLKAVLSDAGVNVAIFFGWSMGVQVGLEFYRMNPNRVSHVILINGTYGRPLDGVPLPFSELALPPLVRAAKRLHDLGSATLNNLSRSRLSYPILKALRVVPPGWDRARYQEIVDEFRTLNLDVYFELLSHLGEHSAESTLKDVCVPCLVIAGTRDLLTPPWLARQIVAKIPGAEFFVLRGGTHYSAVEYPSLVARRIETFLLKNQVIDPIGSLCQPAERTR